jgi:hypothetical protein
MVQEVSLAGFPEPPDESGQAARLMRVAEYLRASGLPDALAGEWAGQIIAESPLQADLRPALRAARQRLDAWLAQQLGAPPDLRHDAARAWLPYWRLGRDEQPAPPRPCCLPATPAQAELEMPIQTIPLRSLGGLVDSACRECLPLGRRISQRIHAWLRGA